MVTRRRRRTLLMSPAKRLAGECVSILLPALLLWLFVSGIAWGWAHNNAIVLVLSIMAVAFLLWALWVRLLNIGN